jgi:hypothetical protein
MSKGSPIIPIRINQIDLDRIEAAVRTTNRRRNLAPYTRSSWIMAAIQDKLDHMARSKKAKAKKRQPPPHNL